MTQITVKEAAALLGRSERVVYAYLDEGKLRGMLVDGLTRLDEEQVRALVVRPPGRLRVREVCWHEPARGNAVSLTRIRAPLCTGQWAGLRERLRGLRQRQEHRFAGTVARYISFEERTQQVEIELVWREYIRPSEEQRAGQIAALGAYFAGVLDWEQAVIEERQVVLHAS